MIVDQDGVKVGVPGCTESMSKSLDSYPIDLDTHTSSSLLNY